MIQPMPSCLSITDGLSNNLHLRYYVGLIYCLSFASGHRIQLKPTRAHFKGGESLHKLHLTFPKCSKKLLK